MVLDRSLIQAHRPAGTLRTLGRALPQQTAKVDAFDVQDDLDEARYLINDLKERIASLTNAPAGEWSFARTDMETQLEIYEAKLRNSQSKLTARSQNFEQLSAARQEFLMLKDALRRAYKQCGNLLCIDDWQTPIYDSFGTGNANRLNKGIAEHILDYKRDGHLDAAAYEAAFISEYASHLGSTQSKAYLTNSGMGAFTTVLNWLVHERQTRKAFCIEPMYFENLHLAQATLPDLIRFNATTTDGLEAALRRHQPNLIFVDAISNCNQVFEHQYESILNWARESTEKLAIVIDTTCLPLPMLNPAILKDMPEHVTVIFIESLAKYHQFGMDAVTGGVIVMHTTDEEHASFAKTRARLGINISDASVGSLPQPNKLALIRRMRRHARNTSKLATTIQAALPDEQTVIDGLSWLQNGAVSAPWFHGTCFTIEFKRQFRSVKNYQSFERMVFEEAQRRELPIALSTSFGFDVSRLYVTAPSTPFEPPFLRISVGTELSSQIELFASILLEAGRKCFTTCSAQQLRKVDRPAETISLPLFLKRGWVDKANGVFAGPDAITDYLTPSNFASPPLIELPADLNPFQESGVRIFAKMMPLVPLMNIKSVPAHSMLSRAAGRGELADVNTLIESSSSNTVLSLSVIGKLFGISKTCAIVDHSLAPGLERMLRLFGIEIYQHPALGHELFGKLQPRSDRAKKMGAQHGWFNPGQYDNPDNPDGFASWLAPDLWKQTAGRLDLLSCALGTCGTMVGVSNALRQLNPSIKVIANCPAKGQAVPGPREKVLLKDVAFDWQTVANQYNEIPAKEAFAASVELLRRGIMGGPSSGLNYAGLLKYLREAQEAGTLKDLLNQNGELWCSFLCCDSPLPHVDEYFAELGDDFFPEIHGVPANDEESLC